MILIINLNKFRNKLIAQKSFNLLISLKFYSFDNSFGKKKEI